MSFGVVMRRAMAGITATAGLGLAFLAPSASAAEAPGPAFVDELGSQLQPLRDDGRGDLADARDAGLRVEDGSVAVGVVVAGDPEAAADKLAAAGMDVTATTTDPRPAVEGYVPLDALADVAKLGVSDAVIPVVGYGIDSSDETDVGAVTSQGVTRHNLPAAIASAGTSGAGIDVGVISDSINQVGGGVAGSQATGDLPANTQVLKDDPGESDEGRAMAEIVFDEAPGIDSIKFASGTVAGPIDKADSINQLVSSGADVIADDIFYLSEPFFQDGVVAKAADAAKAAGVPYFASAGNRARQSYESTFRNSASFHDFDAGAGVDTRSCFSGTVPNGGFIQVALGWDEPVGGVTTDLDLQLVTPGGFVLDDATSANIISGDPKEIATFSNGGGATQVCVEILRFDGTRAPLMKWIEFDNFGPTPVPQFDTASDTINPDAASAQGAMAVAAVSQSDPGLNTPETFSSRGPKTRLFDPNGNPLAAPLVLNKPAFAAADQVTTTVPGFIPFGGTSAAAPSAAGIGAILRATNPQASVNEIYAQMTDAANTIACTSANPVLDCGAGFILADRAVLTLDRTPVEITARTQPKRPTGKGGWFTKKFTVAFDVADPESPIESTGASCGSVQVTKEGTTTVTCDAVSGGGPGSASFKAKLDTKKPKKPKVKGISNGGTYKAGQLPSAKKVKKCKSKDKTSGLKSCKVKGFSTSPGKHKLKATATDKAGLKAKKTFSYTVR